MSESFDVQALASEVASAFQTDHDDYSYSRSHEGADALLKLIRAVVRQEVEAHALRSCELAEEYSRAEAARFHRIEEERSRCKTVIQGRRCTLREWHVSTASNKGHRF